MANVWHSRLATGASNDSSVIRRPRRLQLGGSVHCRCKMIEGIASLFGKSIPEMPHARDREKTLRVRDAPVERLIVETGVLGAQDWGETDQRFEVDRVIWGRSVPRDPECRPLSPRNSKSSFHQCATHWSPPRRVPRALDRESTESRQTDRESRSKQLRGEARLMLARAVSDPRSACLVASRLQRRRA